MSGQTKTPIFGIYKAIKINQNVSQKTACGSSPVVLYNIKISHQFSQLLAFHHGKFVIAGLGILFLGCFM